MNGCLQYVTVGMGKVFHPGGANGNDDSKYSWSPEGLPYYHCKFCCKARVIFLCGSLQIKI